MPQFTPPVMQDAVPFDPTDPLMSKYGGVAKGRTVIKVDGIWRVLDYPYAGRPDAPGLDQADEYFLGGHVYDITEAKADELMAAGFPVQGHIESEEQKWVDYAIGSTPNVAYKGGDGCSSQFQPAGNTYIWLFADTLIGTNTGEYYDFVLPVRNSLVVQDVNRNITSQVYHNFVNGPAFEHPSAPDKWWWPIDLIDEGGTTRVCCWEVEWGGIFGHIIQSSILTLNAFGQVAGVVDLASPTENFFIQNVWEEEDFFYVSGLEYDVNRGGYDNYHIDTQTFTRLARVPQGSFNTVAAWEYWDGNTWTSSQARAARLQDNHYTDIVGDTALTKVGDTYILAAKGTIQPGVRVFSSPTITGPYRFQYEVEAEGGQTMHAKTLATYLPKFHEHMFPAGDHTMVLTYNTNLFGSTGAAITDMKLETFCPNFLYLPVP